MKRFPVAFQAYTVRDELEQEYFGTLARVAEIGYQGVELGLPPEGVSVSDLHAFLSGHELQVVGTHLWLEPLTDEVEPSLDFLQALGGRYLAASRPYESRDEVLEAARVFNRIGERCRARGLQFLYHNHDWEFRRFDGQRVLDLLLDATDPELVKLELDTYWVKRGGEEPAEFLGRLGGRCPLLHVKDVEAGPEQFFAEVGEGILDFSAILRAAEAAGTEWLVVEQDRCRRSPFESLAISYRNLQAMEAI